MPKFRSESITQGDQSWLASLEGVNTCRTEVLNVSAFPAGDFVNGYVPSGYPVAKVGDKVVPYEAGATNGTEKFAGHLLTDAPIHAGTGDFGVAVLDNGRVKVAKVPQAGFSAPVNSNTTIVYV